MMWFQWGHLKETKLNWFAHAWFGISAFFILQVIALLSLFHGPFPPVFPYWADNLLEWFNRRVKERLEARRTPMLGDLYDGHIKL